MKNATQKQPQHFAHSQQNGERLPTGSPPRCATRSMPTGSPPRCATRSNSPTQAQLVLGLRRWTRRESPSTSSPCFSGSAVAAAAALGRSLFPTFMAPVHDLQQPRIFVAYGLPSALCYALPNITPRGSILFVRPCTVRAAFGRGLVPGSCTSPDTRPLPARCREIPSHGSGNSRHLASAA